MDVCVGVCILCNYASSSDSNDTPAGIVGLVTSVLLTTVLLKQSSIVSNSFCRKRFWSPNGAGRQRGARSELRLLRPRTTAYKCTCIHHATKKTASIILNAVFSDSALLSSPNWRTSVFSWLGQCSLRILSSVRSTSAQSKEVQHSVSAVAAVQQQRHKTTRH